ncbi:PglZ domain-containing protein [Thiolapillus sp.]|uniref:PglZ domain-containing protein n=2 Tax=Thiolapillus sp. TaxID=2017437 RepID=UPI0025E34A7C|nr:PglZ domain-containing protein [Thiolapillus sp.]
MTIQKFIQSDVMLPRVKRNGVLVVYDPDLRYRELCQGMNANGLHVVDATESSIESREAALKLLGELGTSNSETTGLLIYVPAPAPVSDEDRQRDPFALYSVCGNIFPEGDGDEYLSLCLKAKPDHATEIRAVFEKDPNPAFAVIDAIGGGVGWPTLRALLGAESSRDILFGLLVPDNRQHMALQEQDAWVAEARDLFKATLGLTLKTRAKAWSKIADELWRFLLFSEFVFDLPETTPAALADVPHAEDSARPLVQDLCDRLRNDQRTRVTYIDRAEAIEKALDLPKLCVGITDLGKRDTFPFEERTFFARALEALKQEDVDKVRDIIRRHAGSVWTGKGESQAQWGLIQAALQLVEACDDFERQLPNHSRTQDDLIDFYLSGLREADRYQREFEQAVGDHLDVEGEMGVVIEQARVRYRRLAEKAQMVFTKQLEASGWPPTGRLANADVFDHLVAPRLQESGRRVAYLLIDALRYELGVALQQQLAEDEPVELHTAYAQLPSITLVGMASLLPGAGKHLSLVKKNDGFVPMLGETVVSNVSQRMEVLRKQFGDRFAEMKLNDFVRAKKALPDTVHLLVLRSVDIDSQLENNPETTLSLIHDTLKRIRVAVHKLKKAGFHDVIIVTDHGFFLNAQAEASDVCASRVDRPLLAFTLTEPDVRISRIRLFRAGHPD